MSVPLSVKDACPIHAVLNEVCGGPHLYVMTDVGNELLGPGDKPVGTPISEMSPEDQAAHDEAVREATPRDDPNTSTATAGR